MILRLIEGRVSQCQAHYNLMSMTPEFVRRFSPDQTDQVTRNLRRVRDHLAPTILEKRPSCLTDWRLTERVGKLKVMIPKLESPFYRLDVRHRIGTPIRCTLTRSANVILSMIVVSKSVHSTCS
jgi:hypothetical protein